MDIWDKLYEKLFDLVLFGNTLVRYTQDDLPAAPFDQKDFDPTSAAGPALFFSGTVGYIGLNGGISRSLRSVGQGVLSHFDSGVRAVAGYADPSEYQHAIVATVDGDVTELWWQGPGGVGRGALSEFSEHITALAGFYSGDGYHHVIVATADGVLTELWWQGPDPAGRGELIRLETSIVDLAGHWTPDGVHHVVVATKDGTITELTWTGAAAAEGTMLAQVEAQQWNGPIGVGSYYAPADDEHHVIVGMSNGTLRELHRPLGDGAGMLHDDLGYVVGIRPIIDAYFDPSGFQHAIVATDHGDVRELWWTTPPRFRSEEPVLLGGVFERPSG